ncbi:TfuA-like protein [Xenorhabdus griffiniae]|uniref:TfuA-like protein n=1 Tax=Xenorhabdus griffiniae TaxID=351672 RepID=UPI0030D598B2
MLFARKQKPVVFGGSSLPCDQRYDAIIEFRPPIQTGDLLELSGSGRPVLITDGLFGSNMSITVVECLNFINAGGILLGSSSMGALRAADCYIQGMVGIGQIFQGYLFGYYHSDADVALRYHTDNYQEITLSYVHIEYIACYLMAKGQISSLQKRQMMALVRQIIWYERYIDQVIDAMFKIAPHLDIAQLYSLFKDDTMHPKKQDARLAIDYLVKFYLAKCE